MSDLVNESLSLSEEDAVAAAAVTSSRLSPPPTKSEANTESEAEVPTLSALASEAIDELPSVKLLKRLQPPTHKLIAITKSMNQHLTSLLVRPRVTSSYAFYTLFSITGNYTRPR